MDVLASRPVSSAIPRAHGAEVEAQISVGAVILAASAPLMFLHIRYQPTIEVGLGSTTATATLSDVAVLAVAVAALVSGVRHGFAPLRAGRALWLAAGGLLAWIAVETFRNVGADGFATHAVTAAKFAEYALLALAVPLLVRRPADLQPLVWTVAAWAVAASAVALLQFVGVPIFDAWKAGWRQPSFLGHHDLAALCGVAFAIGTAGIVTGGAWPGDRKLTALGLAAGSGLILSGSTAAAAGLVVAAAVVALVARRRFQLTVRRALVLAGVVGVVVAGVGALRADPLAAFLRFAGVRDDRPQAGIETYSQRTVLTYIGGRIFLDHAVVGVGWQGSSGAAVYMPYVPDARRKFPNVVAEAFPSPETPWGIQNAYVQAAADLGVVGLGLLLATFGAGLALAARTARRARIESAGPALVALSALLTLMGIWAALGIVAGIPTDAATWLVLGIAALPAAGAVDG